MSSSLGRKLKLAAISWNMGNESADRLDLLLDGSDAYDLIVIGLQESTYTIPAQESQNSVDEKSSPPKKDRGRSPTFDTKDPTDTLPVAQSLKITDHISPSMNHLRTKISSILDANHILVRFSYVIYNQ